MSRSPIRIIAAALALFPTLAEAVVVSGQVTDELGFGIFNVDLDFFDRNTGMIIFTPFDNTDAGGFYAVDVPVSEYDILFDANNPMYLKREIRQVDVTGPMTLDTFLYSAQLVVGHVQDSGGAPLAAVDLNFADLATGDVYAANNDNTDVLGNFSVFVPALTYDVFFTPPLGMPKAGAVLRAVAVAGTTSLGTITLEDGIAVGGRVLAPGGAPAAQIDTDYADVTTGETIYSPRDDTDSFGNFSVLIPTGTYDITVRPPAVNGWAWRTLFDVVVAGPVNVGDVALQTGLAVTGTVVTEALQPVAIADFDIMNTTTGREQLTPDDNTNASGAFFLLPPAGTYDLLVRPPAGAVLAGAVLRNVAVATPLNLGTITLPVGVEISGTVRDLYGAPVAGADFDVFELGSGLAFPTGHDNTAGDGTYAFRLPSGAWTLTVTPPAGSGLLPRSTTALTVSSPLSIDFVLPSSTVAAPEAIPPTRGIALHAAAPNPFRNATRIVFDLPRDAVAGTLTILDPAGRRVRAYRVGGSGTTGSIEWDGRDAAGTRVATGVYFYRLQAPTVDVTRKMTLIR